MVLVTPMEQPIFRSMEPVTEPMMHLFMFMHFFFEAFAFLGRRSRRRMPFVDGALQHLREMEGLCV